MPTIGLIRLARGPRRCADLGGDVPLIGLDFRHRRIADIVGTDTDQRMAVAGRDHPLRALRVRRDAAAEPDLDGGQMVPLDMVGVAAEVLGGELPVAGHDPFVGRDDLDAALAPVDERIDVPGHLAEILAQRRRLGIEGGEPEPLVALQLRHRYQAQALAIQIAMIGFAQVRHARQVPVVAERPAMIGADEARRVAVVGATQPVAAMATDIEERTHGSGTVTHHQHRVFAHSRW